MKEESKQCFIEKIQIKNVRNIIKDLEIPLDKNSRKHLIITGKNGSGKTSTLLAIDTFFNNLINDEINIINHYQNQIEVNRKTKEKIAHQESNIQQYDNNIIKCQKVIDEYKNVNISFSSSEVGYTAIAKGEFLLANFGVRRINNPDKSKGPSKQEFTQKHSTTPILNKEFIQYIVNLYTEKAYAKEDNDKQTEKKIEDWFNNFENSLKKLYNEKNLKFRFIRKEFDFKIEFDGRSFSLDQLSDGYSSILSIVTELILRMETHNIEAYDMQGIVLIDEIETHLHIELQKKILPFLTSFFPKIQFIVTTHSPFILSSLPNAVICDLERRTIHTEKISNIENYFLNDIISEFFDMDLNKNKVESTNKDGHKKVKSMLLDLIKTVKEEG